MIITIDGPAGSGKSTAARELARALGIAYLDTGATYRAATLAALRAGVDLADPRALAALAAKLDIRQEGDAGHLRVILDGQDVTRAIRSAEVTENAHYLASPEAVRKVLVDLQRRMGAKLVARSGGVVTEGRDQGSVVFPEAGVKFYLDAAPEVRARRRTDEMLADGQPARYEEVLAAIEQRDRRDRVRSVAPLTRPAGAIEIDTGEMTIEQVTAELVRRVRNAPPGRSSR